MSLIGIYIAGQSNIYTQGIKLAEKDLLQGWYASLNPFFVLRESV